MPKFLLVLLLVILPSAAVRADVPTVPRPVATLRALDKMTARVEVLELPVNKSTEFGDLIITAKSCLVTQPEETPEAAAYLQVSQLQPGEKDKDVFHGWMFASSPALSAMEHPIYDIWLVGCKEQNSAAAPVTPPTPAAAATVPTSTSAPPATQAVPAAKASPAKK